MTGTDIAPAPPIDPYLGSDFDRTEFDQRRSRVRAEMADRGVDTVVVTGPENIYYLTGLNHQGYFSLTVLVLPRDGPLLLVARAMEAPTIAVQAPTCTHLGYSDVQDPADVVTEAVASVSPAGSTVGVELGSMFFPPRVWDLVRTALPDRAWLDVSGMVVDIRSVKSEAELACIRRVARISDRAVHAGVAAASADTTEREVAAAAYAQLVRGGSEHPGFAPLIRGTDILTHEHVTWRDHALRSGQVLLMELSASVYRYHAPLTRMIAIDRLDPGTGRAAEIALEALEAARSALVPGVLARDVYAAWEAVVDRGLGHHEYRRHHCGYAVGIGFPPSWVGGSVQGLRRDGEMPVREGMVFHLLSWLLGQQPGDYCISDTVVVRADGAEFLTRFPREPQVS